jgi:RNA polymerase sigma-70 factor (ECF subfamily)
MTDAQLVAGALAGKEECFNELCERYWQPVSGWIRSMVHDSALTEDLVEQTMIRMSKKLVQFDPEVGKFRSWLFQIAKNRVRMHMRWVRRHPSPASLDAMGPDCLVGCDEPEAGYVARARRDAVWQLVRGLPAVGREPVVMYFLEGKTQVEIARALGRPRSTVESQIDAALKLMRSRLLAAGVRSSAMLEA